LITSIKLNVPQLKLGCFVSLQTVHKALTSILPHQQPVNSAARNNHALISMTVSYNEINLSNKLILLTAT